MFLESLSPQISRLPREVLVYKILPMFRNYVLNMAAIDGSAPQPPSSSPAQALQQRRMTMAALPSVLQICATQVIHPLIYINWPLQAFLLIRELSSGERKAEIGTKCKEG